MAVVTCPGCLERDGRIAALERRVAELEALVRDLAARLVHLREGGLHDRATRGGHRTMTEDHFLRHILDDPASAPATWLVLADWLEEQSDPRAELTRLLHDPGHRPGLGPDQRDARVRELETSGVRPCVPTLTNSIGMGLALVSAGTFLIGSPQDEEGRSEDEGPQHEVTITRPFLMGVYPVTQAEYRTVAGESPSHFSARGGGKSKVRGLKTAAFPVDSVSWDAAAAFCRKLSELPEEKRAGRVYRLPTEAEWEYSCRGGATSSTPFHFGASLCSAQANFHGEYPYSGADKGPYLGRTCDVGSYQPNAFGLYDLHGQVLEWCADWYGPYPEEGQADPAGPPAGDARVLRGGCWDDDAVYCRVAFRNDYRPAGRNGGIGFRVCFRLD
jgi:uncharacterized protein (TIGR02996 family)